VSVLCTLTHPKTGTFITAITIDPLNSCFLCRLFTVAL
jgi:hypothetical protein